MQRIRTVIESTNGKNPAGERRSSPDGAGESRMQIYPIPLHAENCMLCKIRRQGWFCDLSPQALAEYDALSTHVMLPTGSTLFVEGGTPRNVYVLCGGRVKLTASSRDGKTLLVKVAKPGDVLGLSAALSNNPYEVTAQAIEPVQVKTFSQKDFLHFIKRHVEGSLHAAESMSNEYRSVLSDACRLALSNSIAGRVANLILGLALENGTNGNTQPEIHVPLKHEDIASMLGSSRETVTRVLNDFRRRGIISVKGTKMMILRKDALEALL
jgi:CRP/FNR family transcriptional regulator, cyclic AMP receptor protein